MNYIFEAHDELANVTAFVIVNSTGGFTVGVRDDDAGEIVPVLKMFTDRDAALAYARHIAGV